MPLPYYLGCPQWQDPNWATQLPPGVSPLARYAQVFNTVEGNTTFYATPSQAQCEQWRKQVPDDFRFLLKLPRALTHERMLTGVGAELQTFLDVVEPLSDVLGPMLLQLPASFGPSRLPQLWRFLDTAPDTLDWTVEVRNPAFFAKGEEEKALNQGLRQRKLARVCMDSRAVFSAIPDNDVIVDAQRKKPRVPVHLLPSDAPPVIRYIGHPDLETNRDFLAPWVTRVKSWLESGVQPYVFMHMPDNAHAVALAELWTELLREQIPHLEPLPVEISKPQLGLF
ncbi:DUF72 domain-containing protein [Marinobacter sp. MDS2]|uniref:DUF72 domain-containing protein n=1 Tax=Marinobacter sp. MDS2 TaxID=3065961 RepID=UPI00273C2374|nr:DUF72 domain-containing protein [Marinobacter sp. MDS2]MDP4547114.1 DUF72 domain-containing protein [Marinobacter sp. MDS2]